jgi:hypothetical protein
MSAGRIVPDMQQETALISPIANRTTSTIDTFELGEGEEIHVRPQSG